MLNRVIQFTLLLALVAVSSGRAPTHSFFKVSGVVQYPDGKPTAGAAVTGETACEGQPFRSVQETKTDDDGSFTLQFLDTGCSRVRLSASKFEDLWLKTGTDVFYTKENGISPTIDASAARSPAVTVIRLGERGGQVQFRVWDKATARFIYAGVRLERLHVQGAKFGMDSATGMDGSAHTWILPEGEYEFSVRRYACNGKDYFVARPQPDTFRLEAGQRLSKDVALDVRQLRPSSSYANPGAKPCKPTLP